MTPKRESGHLKRLPLILPPGTGSKKLIDLSCEYSFDIQRILKNLSDQKISAGADMTIKQIARQNNMAPVDVYALVRKIAARQVDKQ